MNPKSSVSPGPHKAPGVGTHNNLGHIQPPYDGTQPHGGPNVVPPTASGGSRTTVAPPTIGTQPHGGPNIAPANQVPAVAPKVPDTTGTGQ